MAFATYSSRTGRKTSNGAKATQSWAIGETVKVGFMTSLEVVAKVATPGDHAPDAYVLWAPKSDKFFRFTPHRGIERRDSLKDALV
ncbi:hypothetical protein [Acidocella sp.]|uniref:hypothetical protein n=1 Tax=Acidocella sp. TaxID=50710 RepID=UPI002F41BD65